MTVALFDQLFSNTINPMCSPISDAVGVFGGRHKHTIGILKTTCMYGVHPDNYVCCINGT